MLTLDKLLAVKAFYFGVLSAKNHDSRQKAITMLCSATSQLANRTDDQNQLRLAFYHLVLAELHRYEGDPLSHRQQAQRICDSLNSLLYEHAMNIIEATTTRTRGPRHEGLLSAYGSTSTGSTEVERPSSWWLDFALDKLGESTSSLSEMQKQFIEHKSLLDLFEKHGIVVAA